MAKIKPLHDKLLVERLQSLEKTAGGIVLPDAAKEKPTEGKVIAIGSGRIDDKGVRVALTVKVGDHVLFGSFSGTQIKEDGKELLILDEGDVLGVIDEAPWAGGGSSKSASKTDSAPAARTASQRKASATGIRASVATSTVPSSVRGMRRTEG